MGSLLVIESLETGLSRFDLFLLDCSWTIDRLDAIAGLIRATSHDVFFHFELEAAVVAGQSSVLPLLVLSGHQGRIAVLAGEVALAEFCEVLKHLILGEEFVVQGFRCSDSFSGILL
jgi:hypothetical protein